MPVVVDILGVHKWKEDFCYSAFQKKDTKADGLPIQKNEVSSNVRGQRRLTKEDQEDRRRTRITLCLES